MCIRDSIYLSLKWHHIFNFTQIVFMVLHQSKISLIVSLQRVMKEGYPKKAANPDIVYSDSTSVFGFLILNVCSSLGEVWKND